MGTSEAEHSPLTARPPRILDMSEHETPASQPADPSPATTDEFEPEPAPRRRWRDRMRGLNGRERVYGLRGVVAVGLAGLVIGGVGGFALHAATGGHDRPDFGAPGRFGPPFDGGHPPVPHGRGVPGQLPPATGPDDGTQPDQSSDSFSGTNS